MKIWLLFLVDGQARQCSTVTNNDDFIAGRASGRARGTIANGARSSRSRRACATSPRTAWARSARCAVALWPHCSALSVLLVDSGEQSHSETPLNGSKLNDVTTKCAVNTLTQRALLHLPVSVNSAPRQITLNLDRLYLHLTIKF